MVGLHSRIFYIEEAVFISNELRMAMLEFGLGVLNNVNDMDNGYKTCIRLTASGFNRTREESIASLSHGEEYLREKLIYPLIKMGDTET